MPLTGSGRHRAVAKVQPFSQHERIDHRDRDRVLKPLELAEDQRAVRPWAGERNIEVIAPGSAL